MPVGITADPASTSPGIFPAYIKGITIFNRGSNLIVEADFLLKQFFANNSSLGSLKTAREELLDKLFVLVVVTTNKNVIQGAFQRREILKQYLNQGTKDTKSVVLSLQQSRLSAPDACVECNDLDNFDDESLSRMGNVYGSDLPFSKSFTLNGTDPQNLALFVVPIYDSNADQNSNILTPTDVLMGKIANEIIIKEGKVNTESVLFYRRPAELDPASMTEEQRDVAALSAGEELLWLGSAHQDIQGEWRTGDFGRASLGDPPRGHPLVAKTIRNSKIADHRNLARIEKLPVNFGSTAALPGISRAFRQKLETLDKIRKNTPTYISDLYYAKDVRNELKLYFAFDYLSALKNNTKYAPLYNRNSDLMSSATLLTATVIRRRIKEPNVFNKLTGGDIPNRMFDDKVDVIGSMSDGSLKRLDFLGPQSQILQFVIADHDMNDITTGLYEYGIEVEILDNTKDKLMDILYNSSNGLETLIPKIEAFLTHSLLKGHYDILTNRYTNKFKAYYNGKYGSQQGYNLWPGARAISKYSSALRLLFGGAHDEVIADLYLIANPMTSGPAGVEHLLRILRDFASSLKFAIGIRKAGAQSTSSQSASSPLSNQSGKRVFKIRQFFQNPMDADDLLEYGLDFLNVRSGAGGSRTGLRTVSFKEWKEIDANQQAKLAGVDTTATSVKFLTPNVLRLMGEKPLELYDDNPATKMKIINSFYRIVEANVNRNSPFNIGLSGKATTQTNKSGKTDKFTTTTVSTIANKNALLNKNNCVVTTFKKKDDPIQDIFPVAMVSIVNLATNLNDPLDASIPLSKTSDFIEGPQLKSNLSGSFSISLLQAGAMGSTSNQKDDIEANMSMVSDALLQTDFFNGSGHETKKHFRGKPATSKKTKSFTTQTFFKNKEDSIAGMQKRIKVAKASPSDKREAGIAPNRALIGIAAATKPRGGDIKLVAPSEMQFAQATIDYNPPPARQSPSGRMVPAAPTPPPSAPTEHIALTAAKYGFIHIVEYLAAYRIGTGAQAAVLIKDPVWVPLEQPVIDLAEAKQQSLICRLRKHETELSNFEGLQMPIFDEIFILGTRGGDGIALLGAPTATPTVPTSLIPAEMLGNIGDFAEAIEYANSYDRRTTIRIIPPPVVKVVEQKPTKPEEKVEEKVVEEAPAERPAPRCSGDGHASADDILGFQHASAGELRRLGYQTARGNYTGPYHMYYDKMGGTGGGKVYVRTGNCPEDTEGADTWTYLRERNASGGYLGGRLRAMPGNSQMERKIQQFKDSRGAFYRGHSGSGGVTSQSQRDASQGDDDTTPSTPSGPGESERKDIYRRFRRWYVEESNWGGGPTVARFFYGDGPFRPWPLPAPIPLGTMRDWQSGVRTIKILWNGTGVPKRRDIVRQFERDTGKTIPEMAFRRSNSSW